MATDPASGVTYYLSVPAAHKDLLGPVRHWSNLKVAFEEERIWVTGFTAEQIGSLEVKTIPYQSLYYAEGPKLFPVGSRLPARNVPALLWSPIGRGLPVELPAFNHNFFGIADRVSVRLAPAKEARNAEALITTLETLGTYMETAPAVRLQKLSWAVLGEGRAIILGAPLLPLPGAVFWRRACFLLPVGFGFELPVLEAPLANLLNPENADWVVWQPEGRYFRVPRQALRPLSISSFRKTVKDTG